MDQSLIWKKANPKDALKKDDDDRLPIHWAVANGHLEVVKLLTEVKNFDDIDFKVRYCTGRNCSPTTEVDVSCPGLCSINEECEKLAADIDIGRSRMDAFDDRCGTERQRGNSKAFAQQGCRCK